MLELKHEHPDEANQLLDQLQLLHPNWQLTKSLSLWLSFNLEPTQSLLQQMETIKDANRTRWSQAEDLWLKAMQQQIY